MCTNVAVTAGKPLAVNVTCVTHLPQPTLKASDDRHKGVTRRHDGHALADTCALTLAHTHTHLFMPAVSAARHGEVQQAFSVLSLVLTASADCADC